ncbi:MAG TPA: hypothetical protein VLH79_06925 [Chthonomonadales bacterium]|nr:hypothetical protein [Chthonomonadales bacterium]
MDEAAKIETFKEWLRVRYAGDVVGLRRYVQALGDGSAADSVVITSQSFVDGSAAGQLVLEPLARLRAALDVLRELDPDNAPDSQPAGRIFDFSQRCIET